MKNVFFNLQEGEKIVEDIRPLPSLRWYFFFTWGIGTLFGVLGFILFLFFGLSIPPLWILFVFAIAVILTWLLANQRYKIQHYWLTNKRVIYKRGLIGYSVSSIPLERISDVIVSRSFVERIFGFGSVFIQSLAGQITTGRRLGSEGSLLAVSDPEGTQKKIFDLIKRKRKEEHITM